MSQDSAYIWAETLESEEKETEEKKDDGGQEEGSRRRRHVTGAVRRTSYRPTIPHPVSSPRTLTDRSKETLTKVLMGPKYAPQDEDSSQMDAKRLLSTPDLRTLSNLDVRSYGWNALRSDPSSSFGTSRGNLNTDESSERMLDLNRESLRDIAGRGIIGLAAPEEEGVEGASVMGKMNVAPAEEEVLERKGVMLEGGYGETGMERAARKTETKEIETKGAVGVSGKSATKKSVTQVDEETERAGAVEMSTREAETDDEIDMRGVARMFLAGKTLAEVDEEEIEMQNFASRRETDTAEEIDVEGAIAISSTRVVEFDAEEDTETKKDAERTSLDFETSGCNLSDDGLYCNLSDEHYMTPSEDESMFLNVIFEEGEAVERLGPAIQERGLEVEDPDSLCEVIVLKDVAVERKKPKKRNSKECLVIDMGTQTESQYEDETQGTSRVYTGQSVRPKIFPNSIPDPNPVYLDMTVTLHKKLTEVRGREDGENRRSLQREEMTMREFSRAKVRDNESHGEFGAGGTSSGRVWPFQQKGIKLREKLWNMHTIEEEPQGRGSEQKQMLMNIFSRSEMEDAGSYGEFGETALSSSPVRQWQPGDVPPELLETRINTRPCLPDAPQPSKKHRSASQAQDFPARIAMDCEYYDKNYVFGEKIRQRAKMEEEEEEANGASTLMRHFQKLRNLSTKSAKKTGNTNPQARFVPVQSRKLKSRVKHLKKKAKKARFQAEKLRKVSENSKAEMIRQESLANRSETERMRLVRERSRQSGNRNTQIEDSRNRLLDDSRTSREQRDPHRRSQRKSGGGKEKLGPGEKSPAQRSLSHSSKKSNMKTFRHSHKKLFGRQKSQSDDKGLRQRNGGFVQCNGVGSHGNGTISNLGSNNGRMIDDHDADDAELTRRQLLYFRNQSRDIKHPSWLKVLLCNPYAKQIEAAEAANDPILAQKLRETGKARLAIVCCGAVVCAAFLAMSMGVLYGAYILLNLIE